VTSTQRLNPTLTFGNHIFGIVERAETEVKASHWDTRGWTYQEALLSRRCLVFTDTQVYLQCLTGHLHEHGGQEYRTWHDCRIFPDGGFGSGRLAIYTRLCEYWHRNLSYETDIINAFSGIFQVFSKLWRIHHFYGIPIVYCDHLVSSTSSRETDQYDEKHRCWAIGSFALGLTWRVLTKSRATTWIKQNGFQTPFPSWTWASLKPCQSDSEVNNYLKFYEDEFLGARRCRGLDTTIQIRIHDLQGAEQDLMSFVEHHKDYVGFRPLLDITSHAVRVSTVEQAYSSESQSIGISAFPHARV
jgi:hypothetical protein